FVTDQDVAQRRSGQGVVDRHDGAAGVAEHDLHPQPLQGGDQQGGPAAFSGCGGGLQGGRGGAHQLSLSQALGQAASDLGACSQAIRSRSFAPVASMGCSLSALTQASYRGLPASFSAIHSRANWPDWISPRMSFMRARVSSVMTRGPDLTEPHLAVSEMNSFIL